MGEVAVDPGDVYTGVCGDVDFDAGRFAAGVERYGHREYLRLTGLGFERGAAAGGGEGFAVRAELGSFEEIASRVHRDVAVSEFDATACVAGDVHVMGDHEDGVAGFVELAENVDDDFFVCLVEVAGGLVSENEFGLIDERASDGDTLLFTTGKICGEMLEAITEADPLEGFDGLRFVGDGVEILGEHDVFQRSEIRHEMKLLEDETDFFCTVADKFGFIQARDVLAVDDDAARSGRVEAAENIDERGFAGAGRAHEGNPFSGLNVEAYAAERAEGTVLLDEIFDLNLRCRLRRGRERDSGSDEGLSGHRATSKDARLRRRPLQRLAFGFMRHLGKWWPGGRWRDAATGRRRE